MEGRKILKLLLWGLGVTIVIGYSLFILMDFIRGPRIIIESPKNGFSTTTQAIMVTGQGIHTNNITINGAQIAVDLNGNFRDQLILAPGYNIIKIVGKDNYSRVTEKTIETVFLAPIVTTATTTATTSPETIESTTEIENAENN